MISLINLCSVVENLVGTRGRILCARVCFYCILNIYIYIERERERGRKKTKQNKAKQNKTKQNKTKQNKTKQNKTKQHKTTFAKLLISFFLFLSFRRRNWIVGSQ